MLAQLAWTLRQDADDPVLPGHRRRRVDHLPGGREPLRGRQQGAGYDPTEFGASTLLFALREGRLVSGPPTRSPRSTARWGSPAAACAPGGQHDRRPSRRRHGRGRRGPDEVRPRTRATGSSRRQRRARTARTGLGLHRPGVAGRHGPGGARVLLASGDPPVAGFAVPGVTGEPGHPLPRVPGRFAAGRRRPPGPRRPGDGEPGRPRRPGSGGPRGARRPIAWERRQPASGSATSAGARHHRGRAAPAGHELFQVAHHLGGRLPARPGQSPRPPSPAGDRPGGLPVPSDEPVRRDPAGLHDLTQDTGNRVSSGGSSLTTSAHAGCLHRRDARLVADPVRPAADRRHASTPCRTSSPTCVLGGRCVGCARPGRLLCRPARPRWRLGAIRRGRAPRRQDWSRPGRPRTYAGTVRAWWSAHKERRLLALAGPLGRCWPGRGCGLSGRGGTVVWSPCPRGRVRPRPRPRPDDALTRDAARLLRRQGYDAGRAGCSSRGRRWPTRPASDAAARAANLAGSMCCPTPGCGGSCGRRVHAWCATTCSPPVPRPGGPAGPRGGGLQVAGIATVAATRLRRPGGRRRET